MAAGQPARSIAIAEAAPPNPDPLGSSYTQYAVGAAHVELGQLSAARELFSASFSQTDAAAGSAAVFTLALSKAWLELVVMDDAARAQLEIDAAKRAHDWQNLSHLNRFYPFLALIEALSGDLAEADRLMEQYDAEVATVAGPQSKELASITRAALSVIREEPGALAGLDETLDDVDCVRCAHFLGGYLHETYGDPIVAAAQYEAYLAEPFFDGRNFFLHIFAASTHERLAGLHERNGDATAAVEHYLRFAEQWADADPALQPRVERARQRAAELSRAP